MSCISRLALFSVSDSCFINVSSWCSREAKPRGNYQNYERIHTDTCSPQDIKLDNIRCMCRGVSALQLYETSIILTRTKDK